MKYIFKKVIIPMLLLLGVLKLLNIDPEKLFADLFGEDTTGGSAGAEA